METPALLAGIHDSVIQNYLNRLEREGLIERDWNARRGIRVKLPEGYGYQLPLAVTVVVGAGGGKHFVKQFTAQDMHKIARDIIHEIAAREKTEGPGTGEQQDSQRNRRAGKFQSSHISVTQTDLPASRARSFMKPAQYAPHASSPFVSLSMQ